MGWYVISDTSYAGYTEIPKHVMNGYELMAYEAVVKQNAKTNTCLPANRSRKFSGLGE
jgi:hypothetical protein